MRTLNNSPSHIYSETDMRGLIEREPCEIGLVFPRTRTLSMRTSNKSTSYIYGETDIRGLIAQGPVRLGLCFLDSTARIRYKSKNIEHADLQYLYFPCVWRNYSSSVTDIKLQIGNPMGHARRGSSMSEDAAASRRRRKKIPAGYPASVISPSTPPPTSKFSAAPIP